MLRLPAATLVLAAATLAFAAAPGLVPVATAGPIPACTYLLGTLNGCLPTACAVFKGTCTFLCTEGEYRVTGQAGYTDYSESMSATLRCGNFSSSCSASSTIQGSDCSTTSIAVYTPSTSQLVIGVCTATGGAIAHCSSGPILEGPLPF